MRAIPLTPAYLQPSLSWPHPQRWSRLSAGQDTGLWWLGLQDPKYPSVLSHPFRSLPKPSGPLWKSLSSELLSTVFTISVLRYLYC